MADVSTDLLEMVLRELARVRGEPWYPSVYSQETGVPRDALDRVLDQLRLATLVRLTDWEQGRGQGYALTPEGQLVLDNPRLLARLREGREVPRPRLRTAPAEERSLRGTGTYYDRAEAIRAALLGSERPAMTQFLLWANVLVFAVGLWMAMQRNVMNEYLGSSLTRPKGGGNDQQLIQVGMIRHNTGGLLLEDVAVNGQWWRLVSYCFVHGGILHIGMNMFVLYMFGSLVEKMWGRVRFLIVYLVSGVGGAVLQMVVQPQVFMVGASGCLCGLLGSMGVWVLMNRRYLPAKLASNWMNNLIMNVMLIAFISLVPGISWAGHLGGGLAGAAVSVPLVWTLYGEGAKRWLGWVGTAAVPVACAIALYPAIAPEREQLREEELQKALAEDPEWPRARKEYGPALRAVDLTAGTAFERYARPFLKGGEIPKADADDVKEARAAFAKAQTRLKEQAEKLGAIPPFANPLLQRHVQLAKECAEKMGTYFERLSERLTPAEGWPERRVESNREWQEILEIWKKKVRGPLYDLLHQ